MHGWLLPSFPCVLVNHSWEKSDGFQSCRRCQLSTTIGIPWSTVTECTIWLSLWKGAECKRESSRGAHRKFGVSRTMAWISTSGGIGVKRGLKFNFDAFMVVYSFLISWMTSIVVIEVSCPYASPSWITVSLKRERSRKPQKCGRRSINHPLVAAPPLSAPRQITTLDLRYIPSTQFNYISPP